MPEIYDSLDMPVYYWGKIHETGDLSWLLVKRMKRISKKIGLFLKATWDRIYDEFISEFGLPESFKAITKKKVQIAMMKMDLISGGDPILQTFIEIEEQELEAMTKSIRKTNFLESKKAIEYKFKFQINMKDTSVREFYSYLKDVK